MQELQTQQHDINDTEVLEDDTSSSSGIRPTVFNQQNNFHLTQNIDLDKLNVLSQSNPELAKDVMDLYKKQFEHNTNIDDRILKLEENEQKLRVTETPYKRKFAFTALTFAWTLSIGSLITAYLFAEMKYPYLAGTAIAIPIGVAVANMLGFKSASQKENTSKKEDKEEE